MQKPVFYIGSWYYSTNFGDSEAPTEEDIQNRKNVLEALLRAVPEEKNMLMRYVAEKKRMTGTTTALSKSDYRDYSKNTSRLGKLSKVSEKYSDPALFIGFDYGFFCLLRDILCK